MTGHGSAARAEPRLVDIMKGFGKESSFGGLKVQPRWETQPDWQSWRAGSMRELSARQSGCGQEQGREGWMVSSGATAGGAEAA